MQELQKLVTDLEAQHQQKHDYIVNSGTLVMADGRLTSTLMKDKIYLPNEVCHGGLSDKLGIPLKYYRKMRSERPELLDISVNHWLQHQGGTNVMLRTFENVEQNIARAFLSDRYMALDNYDVLFAALDAIKATGVKVEIRNADVTERRMYLNIVAPEVEIDAKKALENYKVPGRHDFKGNGAGNGVISGLTITNSEVGEGQFLVRPRAVILKCNNGLIVNDDSFSRIHLGGKLSEGIVKWSQETKNKNYELIMSQVKDAVNTFLNKDYLGKVITDLEAACQQSLDRPVDTVNNVCKELSYNDEQRGKILNHFLHGGDLSAAGVAHAITLHAQEENADTRNDMEVAAFAMLGKIKNFDRPFSGN